MTTSSTQTPTRPFLVLLGPLLAGFIGLFSEAALNIALPDLMHVFAISTTTAQWLTTGYLLMVGMLLPLSSLLVRWFTTRQLVFTALAFFAVGATVSALAPGFGMLVAGRLIQGAATGILIPLIVSTAVAAYPPERRGSAMGLVGLVLMFAPAISPTVSGLVVQTIGWQWIFWLMLPLVALSLVVSVAFLRNVQPITRPHVDVASVALSTIGLGLFVFAMSSAGSFGITNPLVWGSFVVGIAALAVFVHRQLHLPEPILDVRVFAHRNFAVASAMIMANNALLMCAIFLLPMYLEQGRAVAVFTAGLIMLPGGVVNGLVSVWAGRATDTHRPWVIARVGFAIATVAAAAFLLLGTDSPLWMVVAFQCLLMVGVPLAMTPTQTHGLNALPGRLGADGSTAISTLQQVGGALGTAFAAGLLSAGRGAASRAGASSSAATIAGVHEGLVFSIVLGLIGLGLGLALRRGQPADEPVVERELAAALA
ncbi:MAG: DHA2 family efflux MFS transporter permease subunit [Propionibacterium freudenreichii]